MALRVMMAPDARAVTSEVNALVPPPRVRLAGVLLTGVLAIVLPLTL
jgi:hypothetical protein